jgi:hypothetical protein
MAMLLALATPDAPCDNIPACLLATCAGSIPAVTAAAAVWLSLALFMSSVRLACVVVTPVVTHTADGPAMFNNWLAGRLATTAERFVGLPRFFPMFLL